MKSILFVLGVLNFRFSEASFNPITDGIWQQECHLGLIKKQTINSLHIELHENFYQDQNCQNLSFIFKTIGSLRYEDFSTNHIKFSALALASYEVL